MKLSKNKYNECTLCFCTAEGAKTLQLTQHPLPKPDFPVLSKYYFNF